MTGRTNETPSVLREILAEFLTTEDEILPATKDIQNTQMNILYVIHDLLVCKF